MTQGDPLLVVLDVINLTTLTDELWAEYPGLLSSFYEYDAAFDGSERRSAQLLNILMERGADRGYFPKPTKLIFISDTPEKEEGAKREFFSRGARTQFFKW